MVKTIGAMMASEYVEEGAFAAERYQFLMAERDRCVSNAIAYWARKDFYLYKFWAKAAHDFERRARGEYVRPFSLEVLRAHAGA